MSVAPSSSPSASSDSGDEYDQFFGAFSEPSSNLDDMFFEMEEAEVIGGNADDENLPESDVNGHVTSNDILNNDDESSDSIEWDELLCDEVLDSNSNISIDSIANGILEDLGEDDQNIVSVAEVRSISEWGTSKDVCNAAPFTVVPTADSVSIGVSPLGKYINGLFGSSSIRKGDMLTIYPGVYRELHAHQIEHCMFLRGITINNFTKYTERKGTVWILDAEKWRDITEDGLGHFTNSCHPHLPPPYNTPNVQYFEEEAQLDSNGIQICPPLIFVQAVCDFDKYTECLSDYHWLLIGLTTDLLPGVTLGGCGCANCDDIERTLSE